MVGIGQVAVAIKGIPVQCLFDLTSNIGQLSCGLRLFNQFAMIQLLGHKLGQVRRNEFLEDVSLVVHDAIDAKIQVGAIELE